MSIKAIQAVFENSTRSGSELTVLLAIADYINKDGECWPTVEQLGEKVNLKERQVKRIIKSLTEANPEKKYKPELIVNWSKGRGNANTYSLVYYNVKGVREDTFSHQEKGVPDDTFSEIKGDTQDTFFPTKGVLEDTIYDKKGVGDDTFLEEQKPEKVSSEVKKGVLHDTPTVNNLNTKYSKISKDDILDDKSQTPEKKAREPTPSQKMFSALVDLCQIDLKLITKKNRGKFNQAEKRMRDNGYCPDDVKDFGEWWYENDWRGTKTGQPPTLEQIRECWGQMLSWRKNGRSPPQNGQYGHGHHRMKGFGAK